VEDHYSNIFELVYNYQVVDSDLLVAIDTEVADTQQTTLVNFD
jgi:hypothetical protein